MENIIEKILEYVEPDNEITADSTLRADCGLTSFDLTSLIGDLCAEYGKDYKTLPLKTLNNVADLAALFADGE